MNKPLVSIICPVFNAENYIEQTIESVLRQSYSNIEFIVIDGKSTDRTLSIVNAYKSKISNVISEPDLGMYDALVKGFKLANGEIICYINAGDFLNSFAIEAAVEVFENPKISWITGVRSVCNENNIVTHVDLPFRYKSTLIQTGSYGERLPFIQQESTIWRRFLLDSVDFNYLNRLKFAGDYYLWWSFSHVAQLQVVSCPFGIFKKHSGQLSEDIKVYFDEMKTFTKIKSLKTLVTEVTELFFWALQPRVRHIIFKNILRYNHKTKRWDMSAW